MLASLAVRGGAAPGRRLAVRARGGRRHRGVEATHGDVGAGSPWASVTKLATAVACSSPPRRGSSTSTSPPGRRDRPFRHLLAHASGLPFERARRSRGRARGASTRTTASRWRPRSSRERAEMPFAEYFAHLWAGTGIELDGSAGSGAEGTLGDLLALARELQAPPRIAPETLAEATPVQFPGLVGVLPGLRPAGAERLGARPRAPRRQVAALDGNAQLAGDVRPLRPERHVPLGRSRGRDRARLPDRPRRSATGRWMRGRGSRTRCSPRHASPDAVAGSCWCSVVSAPAELRERTVGRTCRHLVVVECETVLTLPIALHERRRCRRRRRLPPRRRRRSAPARHDPAHRAWRPAYRRAASGSELRPRGRGERWRCLCRRRLHRRALARHDRRWRPGRPARVVGRLPSRCATRPLRPWTDGS